MLIASLALILVPQPQALQNKAEVVPMIPLITPEVILAEEGDSDPRYAELEAEYGAARKAWSDERRAARKSGKKTDLSQNPAASFYPRFAALAGEGVGKAKAWCAMNIRVSGLKADLRTAERNRFLGELARDHPDAEWTGRLAAGFLRRATDEDLKSLEPIARTWIAASNDPERQTMLRYSLGSALAGLKGERREEGLAMLTDVAENGKGPYAARARGTITRLTKLQIGMVAPDFATADVDGNKFSLSDFRGKVVVLDFWGFW